MALTSLLSFVTSRSKWRKLLLLAQERWRYTLFPVQRLIDKRSQPASTTPALPPVRHTWHYSSSVPMEEEVFNRTTDGYTQDELTTDGNMTTELDYTVLALSNATMVSNEISHRTVFDNQQKRIPELSFKLSSHQPRDKLTSRVDRFIPGVTASIYGNVAMAGGNYGHWMIDGLSRLFLIERYYSLEEFDHFLVPPLRYDFHRESLLEFGIPEHKIIELPALECVQFEKLVATSAPRGFSSSTTPGWMIDAYRERILARHPPTRTDRRIYISRRDAGGRCLINEEHVIALLERHGFEAVELSRYGFLEKYRLFAEANVVVGMSGAGLTNLVFCPRGTTVIEFQPSSLVCYLYTAIATYLNFTYHYMMIDSESLMSNVNKYYGDMELDIKSLEEKLQLLDSTDI